MTSRERAAIEQLYERLADKASALFGEDLDDTIGPDTDDLHDLLDEVKQAGFVLADA